MKIEMNMSVDMLFEGARGLEQRRLSGSNSVYFSILNIHFYDI